MAFMLTDLEVYAAAQRTHGQVNDGNTWRSFAYHTVKWQHTECYISHGTVAALVRVFTR